MLAHLTRCGPSAQVTAAAVTPVTSPRVNQSIETLLQHPRTLAFRFDETSKVFVGRWEDEPQRDAGGVVVLRGMVNRLQRAMYPLYKRVQRKKGSSGVARGITVHKQIEEVIAGKRSLYKRCDKRVKRFFDLMRQLDIKPVASEVVVVSREKGFGTRIDALGYKHYMTPHQRPVLIDYKSGYTVGRDRKQGSMEAPLQAEKNNQLTHHWLQVTQPLELLQREYGITIRDALVVYLEEKKYRLLHEACPPPPAWCHDLSVRAEIFNKL